MHNFIVNFFASFIANRKARHLFRAKYRRKTLKDRLRTINNKVNLLEYSLNNTKTINEELNKKTEYVANIVNKKFNQSDVKVPSKPKTIHVNGKNNHIYVDGQEWNINNNIKGLDISIVGDNNIIELFTPYSFSRTCIEIGNDSCHIKIGKNPTIGDAYIKLAHGSNQHIFIGDNFRFWGKEIICDENSGITIGNDCRFSSWVIIRPSDGHSVIDLATEKVINPCNTNMTIGDRCWIGTRVTLTKNAALANDTIVAAGSVVTKAFVEEKVVVAGNPAKIVKRGVIHNPLSPMLYNLKKAS